MIELKPLNKYQVFHKWDWIRDGINAAVSKNKGLSHQGRPEDAYARIQQGAAGVYVLVDDSKDVGFVIVLHEHDPDGLVMFIWCFWCEPWLLKDHKQEIFALVDKLASVMGAKRQRMQSSRMGWDVMAWGQKVATIFEREH